MTGLPRQSWRRGAAAMAMILASASTALGVHVQTWTHQTQHDFIDGQFDNLVVDNYGELTLGRQLTSLPMAAPVDFVNTFAQTSDGNVFFGSSPHGAIYQIADKKTTLYYTAPDAQDQVLSLAADAKGGLLAGLCGDGVKLVRLTPGEGGKPNVKMLWENDAVEYIWAIRTAPDGSIYLATGPQGEVWKVPADGGKPTVALATGGKNVYSLALDAKGNLFAGTDAHGLVFRVDAQTGKPFVLLDAGDVDVASLVTDEAGNLYVATAAPDEGGRGGPPGNLDDEKPTRPGKAEPDATMPEDPSEEEMFPGNIPKPKGKAPTSAPKKPASSHGRAEEAVQSIHAITPPPLPPELKAMLERTAAADRKMPNASEKEGPLTQRTKAGPGRLSPARPVEEDAEEGNAVYRIAPDGGVTTLLREPDVMLSLLCRNGELLIGTGTEGKLYAYHPETQSQTLLARVNNENVMSLFAAADGTVYFGTSNSGQVYGLGSRMAGRGIYTSPVLDAKHTATWGSAALLAGLPEGTQATIAVRTGNVRDVKRQEKFWTEWSAEMPVGDNLKIPNAAARFLQYRITLTADDKGHGPSIDQVRIAYQIENLPPKIRDLTVEAPSDAAEENEIFPGAKPEPEDQKEPEKRVRLSWDAVDPNHDQLLFRLYYREVGTTAENRADGTDGWIPLARDLKEMEYEWNTKAVPDGKYQVKVVASDSPDNSVEEARSTAQVTSPLLVVNTPPTLENLKATLDGSRARVTGSVKASLCAVTEVRFQVDGQADWQPAAASDKIFDSPSEGFVLATRPLAAGTHRITVRATDAQGNTSYQAVTVNVK